LTKIINDIVVNPLLLIPNSFSSGIASARLGAIQVELALAAVATPA
jgi:hypothetical protein